MTLAEVKNLYLKRQSCRSYQTKEVPEELLKEVCETAVLAPSACNFQPWKLVVCTGDKKKELEKTLQHLGMNKFASDAPVLIAVTSQREVGPKAKIAEDFLLHDLGLLTAHLVLAAESAGLSTCILGWRKVDKICEILSLPKGTEIPVVVALGYASEGYETRAKARKNLDEVISYVK